jgi:chromosomal replication initiator protein
MDSAKINIKESLSFDNFMVGESNREAYQAAFNCVTQVDNQHNWLWIYTDTGLGGTHLLHAIGNELLEQQPNIRVKQIHTERFVLSYRQVSSQNELAKLKESYRELDCLLLDGMQYLTHFGYEHNDIQSELINILSTLNLGRKLVVFIADRPINELPESNIKHLLSRCKQTTVSQPEITLKKQLTKHFALQQGYELSDEIISFISKQYACNIRTIEGLVISMLAKIKSTEEVLSLSFVKDFYIGWHKRFYK